MLLIDLTELITESCKKKDLNTSHQEALEEDQMLNVRDKPLKLKQWANIQVMRNYPKANFQQQSI